MTTTHPAADPTWRLAAALPAELGESPLWVADEACLYHCDIAGHELRRIDPASGSVQRWAMGHETACVAPCRDGDLLVARRDGLWRFEPRTGASRLVAPPPYDPSAFRFNDGKCDAAGRFWVGTLSDARANDAVLYRCDVDGVLEPVVHGLAVANGIAWSPDQRTMYWSDTKAHTIHAADFDLDTGTLSSPRVFANFAPKDPADPASYGGRPDGAAVDAEGAYWVAMYEGARLLRLSPRGEVLRELRLPVQCPTMPCFGGPDLRTLFVTTVREKRPAAELAAQPAAGCVLAIELDVPGLPSPFFG